MATTLYIIAAFLGFACVLLGAIVGSIIDLQRAVEKSLEEILGSIVDLQRTVEKHPQGIGRQ